MVGFLWKNILRLIVDLINYIDQDSELQPIINFQTVELNLFEIKMAETIKFSQNWLNKNEISQGSTKVNNWVSLDERVWTGDGCQFILVLKEKETPISCILRQKVEWMCYVQDYCDWL